MIDINNNDVETTTTTNQNITNENPYLNNEEQDTLQIEDKENNLAKSIYPDGFDAELYNLETNSLRTDKVKELLDKQKEEIKSLTSQKENLRRIISKGNNADLSKYEAYKPDSRYEKFYNEAKDTKEFFNEFNKIAYNNSLNTEQHKNILDFLNKYNEKLGYFDARTDAEKELQLQDWRREEYKKIGENAEQLIKKNMEYIKNNNFLNEQQKQDLIDFANSNASNLKIINSFREMLNYEIGEESNIPTMLNATSGLPDDKTLWLEFINEKTPDIRKEQIIKERIKLGRPAEWQL